jgi:hypothetical protein
MTVNTAVTAVVENKSEEKREESCTECVFVELGQVTEETKGGVWGGSDGGMQRMY